MSKIKVLDCTLRDGGYVNNWQFGAESVKKVLDNLNDSKIEYIEAGYLKNVAYSPDVTLFDNFLQINDIIPRTNSSKIAAMVVYNQFDETKIIPKTSDIRLDAVRVNYKKEDTENSLNFIEKIIENGYEVFVNPANIQTYSDKELLSLLKRINKVKPTVFCIVDTNGVQEEKDVLHFLKLIDENLDENIALGFHSHNNKQLSFSNAQCLIKNIGERNLIIDSSVFGMGRGAGNLHTELLLPYLNENTSSGYKLLPILKIIDDVIRPIFEKTPWGYSVPYFLAAEYNCHPNYAKYLTENRTNSTELINSLLCSIPEDKKPFYDENLIKKLACSMQD